MKKKNKFIRIPIRIIAGQARSGPPISTSLAQHGINLPEFCKEFNARSLEITNEEVEFDVIVFINTKTKKFTFKIKGLSISYLLDIIYEHKKTLKFLDVYKIFLIQHFFFSNILEEVQLRNLLHSLKSFEIKNINK